MNTVSRRASGWLHRHPKARLGALLTLPVTWLVLAYLGSLAALFLTSLYSTDPFTSDIVKKVGAGNFSELASKPVYRAIALRTVGIAAAVTMIDIIIALPMALFMAKVAKPRTRRILVVAVLMPLWASYLVKGYAWRAILEPTTGVLKKTFGYSPGYGTLATIIGLAYLWLPYMILPIQAGLDRLPDSLLEASADLGGKGGTTIRRVVLPMLIPAIVAGTIFTFSLSLGDYITVQILGAKTQMIGNVVYANFGVSNIPFAAAFALVPVVIMVIYLLGVRRTGAFENL
jgi:ABC-type spermidine/putrescine transport system permease subunit I